MFHCLFRHKDRDRIRERITRKRRDESSSRRRREGEETVGSPSHSSPMSIISRLRGRGDEDASRFGKLRSSSLDCNSDAVALRSTSEDRRTSSPYVLDNSGVIKASLTIPVQLGGGQHQPLSLSVEHSDIPFIEDAGLVFDI